VKPGADPAVVERETDAVVGELLRSGPTGEELARAQNRALADFVRGAERLGGFGGRSDILAQSMTFGGRPEAYLDRLEGLATATSGQVSEAARKWLEAPHYTMVVTPLAKLEPAPAAVDRKVLPSLGAAPEATFPAVQRATLANGLKVMLLERHGVPIVQLALAIDAGYSSDSAARAGAASLALELMDEGTTTRDAFRIADELDALGARLSTSSSLDLSFVRLQALPMNLRRSLEIFADVVRHPAFPPEMVALEKRRRLAQIGQEKVQPFALPIRIVPRLLYGSGHAYGNPGTGSGYEGTVGSLTRDDLVAWHAAWAHPNNSTLIVTGDVTLKDLLPDLEGALAGWKPAPAPGKDVAPVARTAGRKVYLVDKPDAPQSVIVAAHLSEAGGDAEDLAIETVMVNFGGMATSRLNRNLRLDKHWSYGTSGRLTDGRGPRTMMVIAPVQTDKTKESMIEVAKELRGAAGERPLAGEEYASIMRNQTMRLPGRFETLAALETAAIDLINYRYPDDYYAKYASNVRGLSEADLSAVAKKFIRPEEAVWVVIGDLKKIEAGVRELGFGDVVTIDTDGNVR